MQTILITVGVVLSIAVLGFLVWLISSSFASRKELAGQSANIGQYERNPT